jgi:hypothetical protein
MTVARAAPSLIPTLLPKGEGTYIPLPSGEGLRVREETECEDIVVYFERSIIIRVHPC